MTLYKKALDTYKAIHGSEPQHLPYKGASDTPFNGLDVDVVSELCNARDTRAQVKEWKKQYSLDTSPLESTGRFLKIKNTGRKNKNLWHNAIWVPDCTYSHDLGGDFLITENISKDTGRVKVTTVCESGKPEARGTSLMPLSKFAGVDRAKIRIPNPAERDLWDILTSTTNSSLIKDLNVPKMNFSWKNKRRVHLKELPKVEYYIRFTNVFGVKNKPVFPQAIFHTSHGYPLIFALEINHLSLSENGEETFYRGSEISTLERNVPVIWAGTFHFLGEVFQLGSQINTISERFRDLKDLRGGHDII